MLLEDWQQYGFCDYEAGLIWTVNPESFAPALKEWLPDWYEDPDTFVFLRTAFGDLLISHRGDVGQLNVHYGRYVDLGADIEMFMDYSLGRARFVDDALDGKLAKRAIKKVGPLASDEMLTFEPALALGGAPELKYVKKVKMMPQLSLLVQLYDHITIE